MKQTASVAITVKIGSDRDQTFTVVGETDGNVQTLADQLAFTARQDVSDWLHSRFSREYARRMKGREAVEAAVEAGHLEVVE